MYGSIVVGTDGTDTAARAVDAAAELARRFGARLHLVSAYRSAPVVLAGVGIAPVGAAAGVPDESELADEAIGLLEGIAAGLEDSGIEVETHAWPGEAVDALLSVAEAYDADLIVVGSKGMAGPRRILGSVPNSISHRADTAVLIVKTTG
ncbi:MAG TPA: universal stress protein [Acidimicrobiales bacterium]|nr:universal stress protein [Acidimicrobiales bacterium]